MEGYLTVVEAKPLHPIDKTFCLVSTNDVNCCYLDCLHPWASAAQCEPKKRDREPTNDNVSVASPMIKSSKG